MRAGVAVSLVRELRGSVAVSYRGWLACVERLCCVCGETGRVLCTPRLACVCARARREEDFCT